MDVRSAEIKHLRHDTHTCVERLVDINTRVQSIMLAENPWLKRRMWLRLGAGEDVN